MSTPRDTEGLDVVIIGGGAAGLMCAAVAAARGRRVAVLDHAHRVGRKILMSGGGRCNFTNLHSEPGNFLSANPHFCKSALARYTPYDFLSLVERHRVRWHEKEAGQLFCDDSSKDILRMLLAECDAAGAQVRTSVGLGRIEATSKGFELQTTQGWIGCDSLVIATGGLSIPKMGATGFGYEVARRFGLPLRETRAGLVPLTLSGRHLEDYAELAGVSLPVRAEVAERGFTGPLLFTHRGISGPAVLQISSYWTGGALHLDLLPDHDAEAWLRERRAERPDAELRNVLADVMPKRVAQRLCERFFGQTTMRRLDERQLLELARSLSSWELMPSGSEGYRTAEVTLGGVDTDALSSSTMMAREVQGLHFIGEVVDVTGHLGGHNFQWAWASAQAAGAVV